jgi:5'-3' exonuclease
MGVKNLSQFLKKYKVHETLNIEELKYTKIAIDTPLYLYKFKCQTYDWLQCFVNFITFLRTWDIHPIFIFEGKSPPPEKHTTQNYRREQKQKIMEKTDIIEQDLNIYIKTGESSPFLLDVSNKLENKRNKSLLVKSNQYINDKAIKTLIDRRRMYEVVITQEDLSNLKELLSSMGISYIQSYGEAETDCIALFYTGLVDYILSEDTDVLVYTTKNLKVITTINTTDLTFTQISKDKMLQILNLSEHSFRDFCIMCGTDYNKNIFRIGVEKSYKLMQEYSKIENIPLDTSILNHVKVREIFTPNSNHNFKNEVKWCVSPSIKKLKKFFFEHNLNVKGVVNALTTPSFNFYFE